MCGPLTCELCVYPKVKLRAANSCFRQAAELRHQIEEPVRREKASRVSIASMLQQHR
jgi:hypothetical protein